MGSHLLSSSISSFAWVLASAGIIGVVILRERVIDREGEGGEKEEKGKKERKGRGTQIKTKLSLDIIIII